MKFREKWPWNKEFLRPILIVPSVFGILATLAFYPSAGIHSLWFLTAILYALVFYAMFSAVGRRVAALPSKLTDKSGETVEALLVIGFIQSPGIVTLFPDRIELLQITGKSCTIALSDIRSVHEGRWLPGKFVWGERAFNFSTTSEKRLGFAVPESVGAKWSARIRSRG